MTDYVIIPYDNGQGWICILWQGLENTNQADFLCKNRLGGLQITTLTKQDKGFTINHKTRSKYIYKSPFDIIKRLAKVLGNKEVESISPNSYNIGGSTISILNENSRGTIWKFVS